MFPECLSLHAVDRARAGICLGRSYVSSFIPPVSRVVSSVYALGKGMEGLAPGAQMEANQSRRCEAGKTFLCYCGQQQRHQVSGGGEERARED